jgi:glycine cleavage system aminomethyltransferase T
VQRSLALAYVDTDVAEARPPLLVSVVGELRAATVLERVPYDPEGALLRG